MRTPTSDLPEVTRALVTRVRARILEDHVPVLDVVRGSGLSRQQVRVIMRATSVEEAFAALTTAVGGKRLDRLLAAARTILREGHPVLTFAVLEHHTGISPRRARECLTDAARNGRVPRRIMRALGIESTRDVPEGPDEVHRVLDLREAEDRSGAGVHAEPCVLLESQDCVP